MEVSRYQYTPRTSIRYGVPVTRYLRINFIPIVNHPRVVSLSVHEALSTDKEVDSLLAQGGLVIGTCKDKFCTYNESIVLSVMANSNSCIVYHYDDL